MTELSFLIDLLLNHKLPKPTKDAIAARIKEVEEGIPKPIVRSSPIAQPIALTPQPIIAHTPEAAAALASREALMSGKRPDVVPTGNGAMGPRKW